MSVYGTRDHRAVLAAVLARPDDQTPQRVLLDLLQIEGGQPAAVAAGALLTRRLTPWDVCTFPGPVGGGGGSGRGGGRGSGGGIGSGRGSGRGIGSGIGSGIGIGSGSGSGGGSGGGGGRGSEHPWSTDHMEIGTCYLVHCGDWHTFVGRVVAQLGPVTYKLDGVSKVYDTHAGDNWEALAAGEAAARSAAEYRHYTTPAVIPLAIAAFEWVGKLPQEALADTPPEPSPARRRRA